MFVSRCGCVPASSSPHTASRVPVRCAKSMDSTKSATTTGLSASALLAAPPATPPPSKEALAGGTMHAMSHLSFPPPASATLGGSRVSCNLHGSHIVTGDRPSHRSEFTSNPSRVPSQLIRRAASA